MTGGSRPTCSPSIQFILCWGRIFYRCPSGHRSFDDFDTTMMARPQRRRRRALCRVASSFFSCFDKCRRAPRRRRVFAGGSNETMELRFLPINQESFIGLHWLPIITKQLTKEFIGCEITNSHVKNSKPSRYHIFISQIMYSKLQW